jgi:4-diphosphocytidyl-2-C-methyl-D-erythritol kinase
VRHEPLAVRGQAPARERDAVPAGAENLVLRAARHVHAHLGLPGGARFRLVKRIPSQAGLGGGSADAAAAIAAVLALHGVRLARADRLALGAEMGSDVPFALTGGTAAGLGRGERLRPLRLAVPLRAVLAVPRWGVSTAEAYRMIDNCKYGLTGWKPTLRFVASLGRKEVTASCAARLGNTFERVLGHHQRDFDDLCGRLRAAGLHQPRLTGSGSGVFGILPEGVSAREVVDRFSGDERLYVVRSRGRGLRLQTPP